MSKKLRNTHMTLPTSQPTDQGDYAVLALAAKLGALLGQHLGKNTNSAGPPATAGSERGENTPPHGKIGG
jgi:hypothetical protein